MNNNKKIINLNDLKRANIFIDINPVDKDPCFYVTAHKPRKHKNRMITIRISVNSPAELLDLIASDLEISQLSEKWDIRLKEEK